MIWKAFVALAVICGTSWAQAMDVTLSTPSPDVAQFGAAWLDITVAPRDEDNATSVLQALDWSAASIQLHLQYFAQSLPGEPEEFGELHTDDQVDALLSVAKQKGRFEPSQRNRFAALVPADRVLEYRQLLAEDDAAPAMIAGGDVLPYQFASGSRITRANRVLRTRTVVAIDYLKQASVFDIPGRYEVKVLLVGPGGQSESNVLTLIATGPPNGEEAAGPLARLPSDRSDGRRSSRTELRLQSFADGGDLALLAGYFLGVTYAEELLTSPKAARIPITKWPTLQTALSDCEPTLVREPLDRYAVPCLFVVAVAEATYEEPRRNFDLAAQLLVQCEALDPFGRYGAKATEYLVDLARR